MKMQKVGNYRCFTLENEDMVVVLGDLKNHTEFLTSSGFREHTETGEWVGTGADLYAMDPESFYEKFSGREGGTPDLEAQATDGEDFYRIDGLPLVEEDEQGNGRITRITALDLKTRTLIDEGVANFRVG
jgi:hypothetical protein